MLASYEIKTVSITKVSNRKITRLTEAKQTSPLSPHNRKQSIYFNSIPKKKYKSIKFNVKLEIWFRISLIKIEMNGKRFYGAILIAFDKVIDVRQRTTSPVDNKYL